MFNFPVLQVTADLVLPQKNSQLVLAVSRDYFGRSNFQKLFAMIKRYEAEIPAKYKMNLTLIS